MCMCDFWQDVGNAYMHTHRFFCRAVNLMLIMHNTGLTKSCQPVQWSRFKSHVAIHNVWWSRRWLVSSERGVRQGYEVCRVYTGDDLQQLSKAFYSSSTSLERANASSMQSLLHVPQLCRMTLICLDTKRYLKIPMNIHWNNRFGSSASWKMHLLFIMTADLSLGRWTLGTCPESAAQEIWPKLCGWKLYPTWLSALTSPTAPGDHEIALSMIHGGHNYLWNYRIEEKCANKHMQETSQVWRHERKSKKHH